MYVRGFIAKLSVTYGLSLLLGTSAFAGGTGGGGGHPCKLDFMEKYQALKALVSVDVVKKYPWIVDTLSTLDTKNKKALIVILFFK